MKVLHIETGRHLYGGGQQVLWLLEGLQRLGIESVLVSSKGAGIADEARKLGIRTIERSCTGDLDLRFGWQLKQLIDSECPDLVHSHSRRGADWWGGRAARRAGVPGIVSRRVDNHEPAWLAKWRYRPYCKIVAISETIAEVLHSDGIDQEYIEVIRSAVDADRFKAPPDELGFIEQFAAQEGQRLLFCVAQLIPRKGHRYLLEAIALLAPRFDGLRLLIFGQGPAEAELHKQVSRLGLEDIVRFAGFQGGLDAYLGCAELLVHPALEEGLGVAALKAAAAGVPVVGFAAGGLREAVVDGETGLLVTPGDVAALADAIARLLDDSALYRQFAENGRRRMQTDFTVASMVEAHVQLYRSIINDGL